MTNKGDILNSYAVAYTDPISGDQYLYFGLERSANTGDANVGFWFLQNGATCPATGGSFTGNHADGDIFVVKAGPQFELLKKNEMGEPLMATPAISGGLLLVRTEHHVWAIGARQ